MSRGSAKHPSGTRPPAVGGPAFPLWIPPAVFAAAFLAAAGVVFYYWWLYSLRIAPGVFELVADYAKRDARYLLPAWGGLVRNWAGIALAALLVAAFEVASWFCGRAVAAWIMRRPPSGLWGVAVAVGLGNGVAGTAVLGIGLAGLLAPVVLGALVGAPCLGAVAGRSRWWPGLRETAAAAGSAARSLGWVDRSLLGFSAFILVTNFLPALEPAWFIDSLVYHLADPEQFLLERKMCFFSDSSNLPFLQEMQYTLLLGLGDERACKLLHWADGLAAAVAAFALARTLTSGTGALLAAAVLLSQPPLRFLQSASMVELKLMLFETLAIMSFVRAMGWGREVQSTKYKVQSAECKAQRPAPGRPGTSPLAWLALAGCFLGFAHAVKYIGVFASLLLAGWWVVAWRRRRPLPGFLLLVVSASAWTLPWLVKTWYFTGSPVYPVLQGVFPAFNWNEDLYRYWLDANLGFGTAHGDWRNWLLTLLNVSIETSTFGTFGLNPFLLLFLPSLVLYRSPPASARFLGGYVGLYVAVWMMTSQQTRYLVPAVPAAAVAVAFLAVNVSAASRAARAAVVAGAGWIIAGSLFGQVYNRYTDSLLMPYLGGHLDRTAFLRARLPYYPVMEKANELLRPRDRLLMLRGGESFYLERRRLRNSVFDRPSIARRAALASSGADFARQLGRLRITHVLVDKLRQDELVGLSRTAMDEWDEKARANLLSLWREHLRLVYAFREVELFELARTPVPEAERKTGVPVYMYPPSVLSRVRDLTREAERSFQSDPRMAGGVTAEMARMAPDSSHARAYRGYALVLLGRKREAIAEFEAAVRLGFPRLEVWHNLGLLCEEEGDVKRALHWTVESVRRNPARRAGDLPRLFDLAVRAKRFDLALEFGRELLAANPADAALREKVQRLRSPSRGE